MNKRISLIIAMPFFLTIYAANEAEVSEENVVEVYNNWEKPLSVRFTPQVSANVLIAPQDYEEVPWEIGQSTIYVTTAQEQKPQVLHTSKNKGKPTMIVVSTKELSKKSKKAGAVSIPAITAIYGDEANSTIDAWLWNTTTNSFKKTSVEELDELADKKSNT